MPDSSQLSANENRYLPEVEDVLVEAGYRPTQGRAEYRLDIHLEDGPVNADSHLRMLRGNEEIANASARVGGMTTMFRRARVVEDSFRKCLGSFQSQLSSARPRDDRNGQWNEAPPAQEQADWQRGW